MRLTTARACAGAGALAAAVALAGCSSHGRHRASVASSFGQQSRVSGAPTPSPAPGTTPCPVASPQMVVEGKRAAVAGGLVTFSYLNAVRACSGDESARYATTGKSVQTKRVSPSAVILLFSPGAGADELQVPPPALPAAMAAGRGGPRYYTITLDSSGTIIRIEQAYQP